MNLSLSIEKIDQNHNVIKKQRELTLPRVKKVVK